MGVILRAGAPRGAAGWRAGALLAAAVSLAPAALAAAEALPPAAVPPAAVDWQARQISAWGEGRAPREVPLLAEAFPLAERAAHDAAVAALREGLARAHLLPAKLADALAQPERVAPAPERGTLAAWLTSFSGEPAARRQARGERQAAVLAAIERALLGAGAAQTTYADDGRVRLQLELSLDGGPGGLGEAWRRLRPEGPAPRPPSPDAAAGRLPSVRPATGIVVQARGIGLVPSLWPRLVRAGTLECSKRPPVYGHHHLSDEMLRAYGVAPFVRSIDVALRHPRVADRAMLVRALGRCEGSPADVVIADADADAIEAEDELLREGRIVFVVD